MSDSLVGKLKRISGVKNQLKDILSTAYDPETV